MVSVLMVDPVVCHGVDTGDVETPGIWVVVGGVPLEVPSGVCAVDFPGDTEKSGGLDVGPELLETTVEWPSVVCEGVAIGR